MDVAYIGNFKYPHTTENHVKRAFETNGHTVREVQEDDPEAWEKLIANPDADFILWTTTHNYAAALGPKIQILMLLSAKKAGVPVVGFHLDRWFGLEREHDVYTKPFFRSDLLITADGGPDWSDVGINHLWLPPAVSLPETELGQHSPRFASSLVFVGSWKAYHHEWKHRLKLCSWLKATYPRDLRFWPRPGEPGIRGEDLRNLYASTRVVVGDSCLANDAKRYWSDRIPETVGRGGFLIHPYVEGLEDHYTLDEHLVTWEVGDWPDLKNKIDYYLAHPDEAREIGMAGREHVRKHHTYEARVPKIVEAVKSL